MYIKIARTDADSFNMVITEEIAKLPLNLEVGVDIRKYLIYTEIDGFVYIKVGLYDLVNHNRLNEATQEELDMWNSVIKANNWETIDTLQFKK